MKRSRTRLLILALTGANVCVLAAPPAKKVGPNLAELPAPAKRKVDFIRDVHPILQTHCVSCHGPEKQKGGLRLDSRAAALAGGSSYGPAITPGKATTSPLLLFVAHLEAGLEMPPEEEKLPAGKIALLRAWIEQGAVWPNQSRDEPAGPATLGNQEHFFKKAETHWAFQPITQADAAALQQGPTTIDSFIDAGLKAKGLARSPRTDGRTLLKRLHFDLTGLPPTADETAQFVAAFAQDADAAVVRKVDELLDSAHFGERWGRYWLDLARYADTQDFFPQQDLRYPYAWTFRDYVVGSFNDDKPYDQFVREQIAADQMGLAADDPTLAALGYLTVGPRFLKRRDEIINDRIDVVTRGLMGMTVVCARCHDHKYDPIPTADFYALHGVFESTEDLTDLPEIALTQSNRDAKAREDYHAARQKAEAALAAFVQDLRTKAIADVLDKPELYFDALCQMEIKKTADVRKLITGKKMIETALTPLGKEWTALKRNDQAQEDPVIGPLARVAGASPDRKASVMESILRTGKVPSSKVDVHPVVLAALRESKPENEEALLMVYGKLLAQAKRSTDESLKQILAAFTAEGSLFDFSMKDVEGAYRLLGSGRRDLEKLHTAISAVEATHPGAPPRAMAVRDKEKPVTPVIFIRGDSGRRGDAVERRFLSVLAPTKQPFPADRSGRKELADHITRADNPLTPRVWANHVWRHLLGRPLVKTPGDFGLQSEPPAHPELLDWLASALLQRGWSTKKLIRDIVLTGTYQQQSADRPDGVAVDVDNRLHWRAQRRRMDFEAMRDAMLAVSGQLDATVGGRAVNISAEPFSGRRTIYGFVDRVNLDPLFTTFDFPSPDIASPERAETLVPQQALFALNDAFIISQARTMAGRVKDQPPAQALDGLYRQAFQRAPTATEATLGQSFLQATGELREGPTTGRWQYGVGSADPAVPRAKAFDPLAHFDPQPKRYQGDRVFPSRSTSFASLSAAGGHPGSGINQACIRRWSAPIAGVYMIAGELTVNNQGKGDGVRIRIIAAQAGLLGEWIAAGAAAATEVKNVQLQAGEVVDFVVDCRESTTSDGFRWAPTITRKAAAEDTHETTPTVWDAQADFKAPPPPKLSPLEQLAHALLMTNEFMFVD